jgi:hypothetical protein
VRALFSSFSLSLYLCNLGEREREREREREMCWNGSQARVMAAGKDAGLTGTKLKVNPLPKP